MGLAEIKKLREQTSLGVNDCKKALTESKGNFGEALNNIQDMKEWMLEDQKQGIIDSTYAEYYIEYLNASEDLLLEISDYNVNTK